MYWIAHYLNKGHSLKELLSLNEAEKLFYIMSLEVIQKEQVEYDTLKLKAIAGK